MRAMASPRPCAGQRAHASTPAERAEVLRAATGPRFAAVPPAHIVPVLADESVYLASESSLARVLREHGQSARRRRAKAPQAGRLPANHIATAPRQMWCWAMTCLAAEVIG